MKPLVIAGRAFQSRLIVGTGKYKDVRGLSSYVGSAHFPHWPAAPPDQLALLAAGFPAVIAAYFKLILKDEQA